MRQQGRRDRVGFLSHFLGKAVSRSDWVELSRMRECLLRHHKKDTMGLVVRSWCQGRAEADISPIYHLNQEVKRGKRGQLDKLYRKVDNRPNTPPSKILLENRSQVENEVVSIFTNLLQGFYRTTDMLGASPFH